MKNRRHITMRNATGILLIAVGMCLGSEPVRAVEPDKPAPAAEAPMPDALNRPRPNNSALLDAQILAAATQVPAGAEFPTRAAAQKAMLKEAPGSIRLAGYYTAGDDGAGRYKAVTKEPTHAAKFQSADGRWWELAESLVRPEQLGARGNGTDDTTAVSDWLVFIASRSIGFLPAKRFVVGPIRATGLKNVTIYGAAREASSLSPRDPNQPYVLSLDVNCARWELRHFNINGNNHKNARPQALLLSEGTQINARSMTFETAAIGVWFKRGGYCVCDDWYVAGCTEAYVRTGGDTTSRSQFAESNFSNFILDARWGISNPSVQAGNFQDADRAVGIGLDFDFGSAFLKLDHMTGAGMRYGAVLHNSLTGNAWPSRATAPDGIYFTDFNFDWVSHEAFKIDNANLVVLDRAWCRSLLSYAGRISNFGNVHLRSFYGYASHLGGLEIAGSFYEASLQEPGLAGNAWPSSKGGIDLHLAGAAGDKQGLVRVLGGVIACGDGARFFPINSVAAKSDLGVLAEPTFTAELVMDNVYFGGHAKSETSGLSGRANTSVHNCRGVESIPSQ